MPTPRTTDPESLPRLLTAETAAETTGLPLRVVRDAFYRRALPTVKLGKRVYVTADALTEWFDSRTREAVQ